MIHVEISRQPEETGEPVPDQKHIIGFVRSVLHRLDIENVEISLVIADDLFVQDLNRRFRGRDEPTDVLSFAQEEAFDEQIEDDDESVRLHLLTGSESRFLGDIVISVDTLKRNADYFTVAYEEEFYRLLVHGILHLTGMEHATSSSSEEMLVLQEKLLEDLYPGLQRSNEKTD